MMHRRSRRAIPPCILQYIVYIHTLYRTLLNDIIINLLYIFVIITPNTTTSQTHSFLNKQSSSPPTDATPKYVGWVANIGLALPLNIFSIGDNSNLSHAATKTTHTKLFKPYLFIEPPQLNKFLRKNSTCCPAPFQVTVHHDCLPADSQRITSELFYGGWPYKISNNFFELADIIIKHTSFFS